MLTRKQFGTLVFTIVEVVTLVVWFALAGTVLGGIVLVGGLFLEHILADNVKNNLSLVNLRGIPYGGWFLNAAFESLLWIIWLALWPLYFTDILGGLPVIATVFLTATLIVEHSLSDNIFRDSTLLKRLFKRQVIGFSLVEVAGASIWLALIGAGLPALGVAGLAIASFIEHTMAVRVADRA